MEIRRPGSEDKPESLLARFSPRRIHRGIRVSDLYLRIGAFALAGGLAFGLITTIIQTGRANMRKNLEEACGVLARGDELSLEHMQAFHSKGPVFSQSLEPDNISTIQEKCLWAGISIAPGCIAQAIRRATTSVEDLPTGLSNSAQDIQGPCGTEGDDEGTPGKDNLNGAWIN